jgi:leader peptidase (prepilin peptidase) / N-methyltransferase
LDVTLITSFVAAYMVIVGLELGSFINLAADRLPRGESIVRPRSHCRACGRQLNLVDLLPVAGYVIRGGRCATCRAEIGASAALVEAATGALVLVSILWQGLWPGALTGLALVAILGAGLIALGFRPGSRSGRANAPARRAP